MTLYEAMDARRSVRRFKTDPIPRATLTKLIQYAAKAPSGCNDQGWVFVVVDDLATKAKVADITEWGKFIADAGACIAIFCDKEATCVVDRAKPRCAEVRMTAVEAVSAAKPCGDSISVRPLPIVRMIRQPPR